MRLPRKLKKKVTGLGFPWQYLAGHKEWEIRDNRLWMWWRNENRGYTSRSFSAR